MKKIVTIGSGMQDIFTQYEGVETLHLHTKEEDLAYVCMKTLLLIILSVHLKHQQDNLLSFPALKVIAQF